MDKLCGQPGKTLSSAWASCFPEYFGRWPNPNTEFNFHDDLTDKS